MTHDDIIIDIYLVDHRSNCPNTFICSVNSYEMAQKVTTALAGQEENDGFSFDGRVYRMKEVNTYRIYAGDCGF